MFTPQLFISIGATQAFFTLRETYLHEFYIEGRRYTEVRSFHHFNLSQDATEALEKAQEASINLGVPFSKTNTDTLEQQMRDIKRASKEELERREREAQQAYEFFQEQRQAQQQEMLAKAKEQIDSGVMSEVAFRQYSNVKIEELPRNFVSWVVSKIDDFDASQNIWAAARRYAAEVLRDKYPHLMMPVCHPTLTVGNVGERITLNVDVIRVCGFDGFYGRVYIATMKDLDTGACVVSKGSFCPEENTKLTIKASVKKFDEYKGQVQTVLQRVKTL